jgi:small subunit ribosomal protein S2
VIADAVADGLMARSAAQANAGREDGAPAIGGDEPLADWERELLTGGTAEAAAAEAAAAETAAAETAETAAALPETPAEAPTVTAAEVAPVEGVPATGDDSTGTQGAQNG